MAENYLQHAEHYNRIIAAAQAQMPIQNVQDQRDASDDDIDDDRDEIDNRTMPARAMSPRATSSSANRGQIAASPIAASPIAINAQRRVRAAATRQSRPESALARSR